MHKKYEYEYFVDGVVFINTEKDSEFDMESACELLNRQDQRIAELEEQLKNAIVPKFKIGQELYLIDDYYSIVPFEIDKILITDNGVKIKSVEWNEWFEEDECFVTREDAQEILDGLSSTNGQNE